MPALTRDQAIAEIVSLTPLSTADMEGFLACTDDERATLIDAYRIAGIMPTASAWDHVLSILTTCAELANLVIPITGAISGVFGLGHL